MTDMPRHPDDQARPNAAAVAWVIARRELIGMWRRPVRMAAAIGTPLLIWLLLSQGFSGETFTGLVGGAGAEASAPANDAIDPDVSYRAFALPGMMTLTAVFASIFASISLIEQRNATTGPAYLPAVLVSPAPRWSIAIGKIAGGAIVGFLQAMVLLATAPLLDMRLTLLSVSLATLAVLLTAMAMAALGLLFAWRCETTASFHAVMNLVFMPMWLLSGAFFAAPQASWWFAGLMTINPLTWCTQAIRVPLVTGEPAWTALAVTATCAAVLVIACIAQFNRPMRPWR